MKDRETMAKEMFSRLRKHIGEGVILEYWKNGYRHTTIDVLRDVSDFERVTVGPWSIRFIG